MNELLPGELSLGLQIFVVCSEDRTWEKLCYLRLYVKGRGRGVLSILVLWSFFQTFVNKLPPGNLSVLLQNQSVHSKDGAEQTVSFLRLYVEGRGRGVPSKLVLWSLFPKFVNKLPQGIYQFCIKIGEYSQNTVPNKRCAICDSTSKGVAVACRQSWPYSIMSSFLPLYLNELLPEDLSIRLQNSLVHSGDVTWEELCYLWLYVEGHGRGVPSKLAILNSVVVFSNVWEVTPPRDFVRSASKLVVLNKRCALCDSTSKGVAVACCQFWFCGLFFKRLWTNSPQGIYQFCFKIGQYSQNTVQNKRALCDSTSKGVSVACRQSWPFWIECQTVMPFVPFPNPNVSYYQSPCDRPGLPHTAWTATPPTCRDTIHDTPRRTRRGPAQRSLFVFVFCV